MRIQVNVSDETVEKIDKLAKEMGVSRSALCSVWIGQYLYSLESGQQKAEEILKKFLMDNVGSSPLV